MSNVRIARLIQPRRNVHELLTMFTITIAFHVTAVITFGLVLDVDIANFDAG